MMYYYYKDFLDRSRIREDRWRCSHPFQLPMFPEQWLKREHERLVLVFRRE